LIVAGIAVGRAHSEKAARKFSQVFQDLSILKEKHLSKSIEI
jgi:hypothetical protein